MYAPLIKLVSRAIFGNETATRVFNGLVVGFIVLLVAGGLASLLYQYLESMYYTHNQIVALILIVFSVLGFVAYRAFFHREAQSNNELTTDSVDEAPIKDDSNIVKLSKQKFSDAFNDSESIQGKIFELWLPLNSTTFSSATGCKELVDVILNNRKELGIKDSRIMLLNETIDKVLSGSREYIKNNVRIIHSCRNSLTEGRLVDEYGMIRDSLGDDVLKVEDGKIQIQFEHLKKHIEEVGGDKGNILAMYLDVRFHYLLHTL